MIYEDKLPPFSIKQENIHNTKYQTGKEDWPKLGSLNLNKWKWQGTQADILNIIVEVFIMKSRPRDMVIKLIKYMGMSGLQDKL